MRYFGSREVTTFCLVKFLPSLVASDFQAKLNADDTVDSLWPKYHVYWMHGLEQGD